MADNVIKGPNEAQHISGKGLEFNSITNGDNTAFKDFSSVLQSSRRDAGNYVANTFGTPTFVHDHPITDAASNAGDLSISGAPSEHGAHQRMCLPADDPTISDWPAMKDGPIKIMDLRLPNKDGLTQRADDTSKLPTDHKIPSVDQTSKLPADHKIPSVDQTSRLPADHKIPPVDQTSKLPADHKIPPVDQTSKLPADHKIPPVDQTSKFPDPPVDQRSALPADDQKEKADGPSQTKDHSGPSQRPSGDDSADSQQVKVWRH